MWKQTTVALTLLAHTSTLTFFGAVSRIEVAVSRIEVAVLIAAWFSVFCGEYMFRIWLVNAAKSPPN